MPMPKLYPPKGTILHALMKLWRPSTHFSAYHGSRFTQTAEWDSKKAITDDNLRGFLGATNDETRTYKADEFAIGALRCIDMCNLGFFRDAIVRRETGRDIVYPAHRDHSAHTVYNYLLGWLVFEHSETFRRLFGRSLCIRLKALWPKDQPEDLTTLTRGVEDGATKAARAKADAVARKYFGNAWFFASLLHDIGYLLEGSLTLLSAEVEEVHVKRGAGVLNDFFQHRFWFEIDTDIKSALPLIEHLQRERSREPRSYRGGKPATIGEIRDLVMSPPGDPWAFRFDRTFGGTLSALADQLSFLGDVKHLAPKGDNLPGDAFEVWAKHYEKSGAQAMATRIRLVRGVFKDQVWLGMDGGTKPRVLDHGVVGGLILLHHASYLAHLEGLARFGMDNQARVGVAAHRLASDLTRVLCHFGVVTPKDWEERTKNPAKKPKEKPAELSGSVFWWTAAVWGSAACALHNVLQIPETVERVDKLQPADGTRLGGLTFDEDPLTALGLVVDIVQEWDRFDVDPSGVLSGVLPIEGRDVDCSLPAAGGLVLNFTKALKEKKKKKESMERALEAAFGKPDTKDATKGWPGQLRGIVRIKGL